MIEKLQGVLLKKFKSTAGTYLDLSKILSTSESNANRIFNGKQRMTPDQAIALIDHLGLTVSFTKKRR